MIFCGHFSGPELMGLIDRMPNADFIFGVSSNVKLKVLAEPTRSALPPRDNSTGRKAVMHHSDQGSQYTSENFQRLLESHGITCSMSRRVGADVELTRVPENH